MTTPSGDPNCQTLGFLLIPGFALMSYASLSEPFRAANHLAGRELYRSVALAVGDEDTSVRSSGGEVVSAGPVSSCGHVLHTVFVCAGGQPDDWSPSVYPIASALRGLSRRGTRLGGISGGPFVLAAAGLLDDYRFTLHWEHAPALMEAFPRLSPEKARYVIDRDRITCGGGVAPLDLAHALIAERMGSAFARRVSDWYLHTTIGEGAAPQRSSLTERFGTYHPGLLNVLEEMEATVEAPLTRKDLARLAGVGERHLDRLFNEHLGASVSAIYRQFRLDHARQLVLQSPLALSEIAFASGFSSASSFTRAYRSRFGHPPSEERRTMASSRALS